jgi:antagonist of KipI
MTEPALAEEPSTPVFAVEQPGVFTTIQDLGRPGRAASGVPPGGAMDRFALAAANLLVGNPEKAAGLECALSGPTLVAQSGCLVAVTGGDFQAVLNGRPLPPWKGAFVARGDTLSFGERVWGARVYVAVSGGLGADRWLGSASTYMLAGRGGIHGRPLKAGDTLNVGGAAPRPLVAGRELPFPMRPPYSAEPDLMAVPGPYLSRLRPSARRAFFREKWTVSRDADRMGFRLEGPDLGGEGPELVSYGLAMGCVQLPASGQPILLMADHQTAGGYPVIAGVGRCDLPLAAQLRPGDSLRFKESTVESAQEEWRRRRSALDWLKAEPRRGQSH